MKIACEACGAKYTIADDKVRGRKVKIRCKGCGTPIVVDGQQQGSASTAEPETDASLEADAAVIWSVNLSDTDSRTMNVDEIVQGYTAGVVTADAFVWKDGMADWVPLLDSELAPLLGSPAAVAPAEPAAAPVVAPRGTMPLFAAPNQASAAARPAATRALAQPDNTQDLFGAIDVAGAEDEVATSAPVIPQAGMSAYGDGNMTGARNENSVLFSLDALKAGFSPSAPAAHAAAKAPKAPSGAGRPQHSSSPDDPFGMGTGVIGGGALFGADNQALLTAPAAPLPAPPVSSAQVVGGPYPPAAARSNNRWLPIIGAIGGLAIIALLLVLLLGRRREGTTPSAEVSASATPVAVPTTPEKLPQEPAPKAEEAPAASTSPPPSTSAASESKPPAKAVVASSGGSAKAAENSKKKAEEPIPAGASDAPPFSKSAAISGLTAAAMAASACKKPGGPTGTGKATVTFAPSGRVTTATVGGGFAGTAVGGCVASGFRKAHVPPFSGSAVTVSKSFTIN